MKATGFLNVDKNKKENLKEHEKIKKNHIPVADDNAGDRCGYDERL